MVGVNGERPMALAVGSMIMQQSVPTLCANYSPHLELPGSQMGYFLLLCQQQHFACKHQYANEYSLAINLAVIRGEVMKLGDSKSKKEKSIALGSD